MLRAIARSVFIDAPQTGGLVLHFTQSLFVYSCGGVHLFLISQGTCQICQGFGMVQAAWSDLLHDRERSPIIFLRSVKIAAIPRHIAQPDQESSDRRRRGSAFLHDRQTSMVVFVSLDQVSTYPGNL